jgi:ABC-type Fe3+-hydroxamate transport system substrate-binding protein
MRIASQATLTLCLGALTLGLTACGERSEPTGPSVRLYPVTVSDAEDRATRLGREPRRVVALTPATADIVRALGAGGRLVGSAPRFFSPAGDLLAARVRRARPDLVLAAPDTDGVQSRARATGAPVFLAPDGSIEEVEQAITRIGLLLGRPVQARLAVHRIEVVRAKVARELADTRPVTVFVDTGFFSTVSDQSLIGDLIRQANGRNVAGSTPEAGPFDLVQLAQLNPAVYLATSDSQTTLRDLRHDPRTRRLTAVKTGRFAIVDTRLLEPGPNVGEGLRAIATALHPDAAR